MASLCLQHQLALQILPTAMRTSQLLLLALQLLLQLLHLLHTARTAWIPLPFTVVTDCLHGELVYW